MDRTTRFVTWQRIRSTTAVLVLAAPSLFAIAAAQGRSTPPAPDTKMTPAVPTLRDEALRQEAEKAAKEQPAARTIYGYVSSLRTYKLSKEGFRIKFYPNRGDEPYPHYRLSIVASGPDKGPDGVTIDLPEDTSIRIVPEIKTATVTVTHDGHMGFSALQPDKGNLVLTIFKDNEGTKVSRTVLAAKFQVTRTQIERLSSPGMPRPVRKFIEID